MFIGPGSRYTLGLIVLALISIYGLYLIIAAFNKYPASYKSITLTLRGQIILGVFLQAPVLIYIWIGFFTGIL